MVSGVHRSDVDTFPVRYPIRIVVLALSGAAVLGSCAPNGASRVIWAPETGEQHLSNIRQLTFGGNNAEAYFSADGKRLIFQRQIELTSGWI